MSRLVGELEQFSQIRAFLVLPGEMPSTSLHVAVNAGVVVTATTRATVAFNGALAVVASATNYVYVDHTGALAVNQSAFPTGAACAPLAVVVTSATNVISITDARFELLLGGSS